MVTSKAGFQLPAWDMLSEEQEAIATLPMTKSYVIEGAPGTGKTVLALYRAARAAMMGKDDITILVYNRPLMLYLKTAMAGNPLFRNVEINTYHSWLTEFYKRYIYKPVPKEGKYDILWDDVLRDFRGLHKVLSHVIIDEAQDFPIELIEGLQSVSEIITCFIDPNQAIEAGKTHVVDALKKLCVECPRKLTRNYRNTRAITDLSHVYYRGREDMFALPDEKKPAGTKPVMLKCRDYDDQTQKIIRLIRNNRELNICILVNNKSLNVTYSNINDAVGSEISVEMFKAMSKNSIDFSKRGVKILSFGTMKGLEFDMVIITRFEKMRSTGDPVADTNRAYVAVTRACKELVIIYFDEECTLGWADVMDPIISHRNLVSWER